MSKPEESLSLANPHPIGINIGQKIGLAITAIGLLLLFIAWISGAANVQFDTSIFLWPSMLLTAIGGVTYALATYRHKPEGIKNDHNFTNSLTSRGALGWIAGIVITGFYVLLYWFPQYLGLGGDGVANSGLVRMFDPLSQFFKGQPASQWFVYGTLYTLAILVLGFKFIWKYRHNRYQVIRTISVMFFQTGFAFLLPEIMMRLNYPYYDFKNMWPLNYYFFDEWSIQGFLNSGGVGLLMLGSGLLMIFVVSPILTYFYGKRWYCSWVCGCGGLAETAGDPFRHLSDKSLNAWRLERVIIYSVLVFVCIMTIAVLFSFFTNNPSEYWVGKNLFIGIVSVILLGLAALTMFSKSIITQTATKTRILIAAVLIGMWGLLMFAYIMGGNVFFIEPHKLRKTYGFLIGAAFSGVIGVGFYPLLGSRVWCRFGCPMAAILGLQQKFFSRFRITTNGAQCISCGNCSTYCEMGIDVRAYAQKGQDIVRASCVGCGICSAVCPRGVLKLENGPLDSRKVFEIEDGGIKVNV